MSRGKVCWRCHSLPRNELPDGTMVCDCVFHGELECRSCGTIVQRNDLRWLRCPKCFNKEVRGDLRKRNRKYNKKRTKEPRPSELNIRAYQPWDTTITVKYNMITDDIIEIKGEKHDNS